MHDSLENNSMFRSMTEKVTMQSSMYRIGSLSLPFSKLVQQSSSITVPATEATSAMLNILPRSVISLKSSSFTDIRIKNNTTSFFKLVQSLPKILLTSICFILSSPVQPNIHCICGNLANTNLSHRNTTDFV